MATTCCNLVGNFLASGFKLPEGCFISVNNNINTDFGNFYCGNLDIAGQTIGSINLAAYAGNKPYIGCPGRAGVQILWARKFDCGNDITYFIFTGAGRSFKYGYEGSDITLIQEFSKTTKIINASSQGGPHTLYTNVEQIEGMGMDYDLGPIQFNTDTEEGVTLENMGFGESDYYLQNFNIEFIPGQYPVANYTFAYVA